jgi:hypothetical protein
MTDDEWNLLKIRDLQREHDRTKPIQQMLVTIPPLKPVIAQGRRIETRAQYFEGQLRGAGVRTSITWKCARAIEEQRIPEASIVSIFPKLELAHNKGAYFVACAKAAFKQFGLSWIEEEWQNEPA